LALSSQLLRLPSELKALVAERAAEAGLSTSEWIRRAIASAAEAPVGAAGAPAHERRAQEPASDGADRRVSLRAPASEVARWELEAAEHGLNLARYLRLQMGVTGERGRRVATAVETLGAASVQIARIGRNLNQIARSINTMPGQSTAVQRRGLSDTCRAVDAFSDQVSEVCDALNLKLGRRRARKIVGLNIEESA
jgi:predicted DNA binding CopG/RHH family protein